MTVEVMKANPKNALMVVAALLVVYVVAFFVTMKVKPISYGDKLAFRMHMPRWIYSNKYHLWDPWENTFFAPLIWVERQLRPPEYWQWKKGQPVPDWMK